MADSAAELELYARIPADRQGNSPNPGDLRTTSTDEGADGQQRGFSAETGDDNWGSNMEPSRASGGRGEVASGSRGDRSWPEEVLARGAKAAGGSMGDFERITSIRPRMAGSALREARAAAASAEEEGGEDKEAAVAAMEMRSGSSVSGTSKPNPHMPHGGMGRARRGEAGSGCAGRRGCRRKEIQASH